MEWSIRASLTGDHPGQSRKLAVANYAPTGEEENHRRSPITDLMTNGSRSVDTRQIEGRRRRPNLWWTTPPTRSERSKESHPEDKGEHAAEKEEDLPRARSDWVVSFAHGSDLTGVDAAPFRSAAWPYLGPGLRGHCEVAIWNHLRRFIH